MMSEMQTLLPALLTIVGSGGAAWVGVKASLNGQKERLVRVEDKVDELVVQVARMEGAWGDDA